MRDSWISSISVTLAGNRYVFFHVVAGWNVYLLHEHFFLWLPFRENKVKDVIHLQLSGHFSFRVAKLVQRPRGAVQRDETEAVMVTELPPISHTLHVVITNSTSVPNGVTDDGSGGAGEEHSNHTFQESWLQSCVTAAMFLVLERHMRAGTHCLDKCGSHAICYQSPLYINV